MIPRRLLTLCHNPFEGPGDLPGCSHQQEAHVEVHDLVIEPIQAAQAGHEAALHLNVAGLVEHQDLIGIPRRQRPRHLNARMQG